MGGHYPLVNFHTFNQVGYDINTFYPVITLYPFAAIFKLVHNQVNAFYLCQFICVFFTQITWFVSGKLLKYSSLNSILLAFLYTFSGYMLFVNWYAFELGEVLSFMVLPILLVALTAEVNDRIVSKYARNNKGFLLLLSLTWVTYSHFLTTLLCIIISLVVFVFVLIKNNLDRRTLFRDVKLLIIYMLFGGKFFKCIFTRKNKRARTIFYNFRYSTTV